MKLITAFVLLVAARAIYYTYYYLLTRKFLMKYEDHARNQNDWYIAENRQRIVELFKKANIRDTKLPYASPIGYGYMQTGKASVFDNIQSLKTNVVEIVYSKFREAKGTFRSRIFQSFNPIFWIESVIYLPKAILNYLGMTGDSLFIRIIQVLWWIIGAMGLVVGIVFNKDFTSWVTEVVNKIMVRF